MMLVKGGDEGRGRKGEGKEEGIIFYLPLSSSPILPLKYILTDQFF